MSETHLEPAMNAEVIAHVQSPEAFRYIDMITERKLLEGEFYEQRIYFIDEGMWCEPQLNFKRVFPFNWEQTIYLQ